MIKKSVIKYYFKGNSDVNKAYRNDTKMYFKGVIYLLSYLILLASVIFAPLALIVNNNLENDIKENKKIRLSEMFREIDYKKVINIYIIYLFALLIGVSSYFVITVIFTRVFSIIASLDILSEYTQSTILISKIIVYSLIGLVAFFSYLYMSYLVRLELSLTNNTLRETILEAKVLHGFKVSLKSTFIFIVSIFKIVVFGVLLYLLFYFLEDEFDKLFMDILNIVVSLVFYVFVAKFFFKFRQTLVLYYDDLIENSKFIKVETNSNLVNNEKILINIFDENSLE